MKGGAVALDGRIEPGDMILQVNDINFENMTNDDAVRVLRDVVQKPGPIKVRTTRGVIAVGSNLCVSACGGQVLGPQP